MGGYTKLFNSILASSIWSENNVTRIVWITLLAMTNQDGLAETSIPGLAAIARVSMEDCKAAIEVLSAPDEYSRTVAHDGRRIERVSGGYLVLNYDIYRCKMDEQEQADKAAVRQQRWRDRHPRNANVTPRNASNDIAEAKAKAEEQAEEKELAVLREGTPEARFDCSQVKLAPGEFNSTEMARIVWEKLGLAGNAMFALCKDAIDRGMQHWNCSAEDAGEQIIERKRLYDVCKQTGKLQYGSGTKGFLESGKYLQRAEEWEAVSGTGNKRATSIDQAFKRVRSESD